LNENRKQILVNNIRSKPQKIVVLHYFVSQKKSIFDSTKI